MKRVYGFEEGDGKDKRLLGGKGAGLCEMTRIGLPVPPGFVITTEVCSDFYANGRDLPGSLMDEIKGHVKALEGKAGKTFGGADNPLLVSVRSGAAMSMPGMMDTILNLGLNDSTANGLAGLTGNERFAYDAYRRFVQLFLKIALGMDGDMLDREFEGIKKRHGAKSDTDLGMDGLKEAVARFREICKRETGKDFPDDPYEQLETAIKAVFGSWMGRRAVDYRRFNRITPEMAGGTAVNIQAMVFGNMGWDSATGVAFTRDPATGEDVFYGEYLPNAQGEDVVAGARTPKPIAEMEREFPRTYRELCEVRKILERHYREVQDFEFTMERGRLYMLQTRNGKMNATASIRTSVDMANEGLITREDALLRVRPEQLEQLLHRRIDPKAGAQPVARGLAASPGAASGMAVFSADEAAEQGMQGKKVILVREETKPDDIHGFFAAEGVLTSRGGKTSHAAVVARGIGKPCVSGCGAIKIDHNKRQLTVGGNTVREGDMITIDGTTGDVYLGLVRTMEPEITPDFDRILEWADGFRALGVRVNADTPEDAARARELGAEGIGLCRTERMFNSPDRLPIVHEMIMTEAMGQRRAALDRLLAMQRKDFADIFRAMDGLPVTIRLLDPPLHEFLPSIEDLLVGIMSARAAGKSSEEYERMLRVVKRLYEVNPMLGHRGVRLGITSPEIYEMQVRAIMEAAMEVSREGRKVLPEIMIPQVCSATELKFARDIVDRSAKEVMEKAGAKAEYMFGTMMEVVRACLTADGLAKVADFFSFGTNDLTQSTFSFSREDAENKFLPAYIEKRVLVHNPFEILDRKGVGKLIAMAVKEGRAANGKLKIGICGEHGGEPSSIEFCHRAGLDYVSCSVYRLPIARLAAAQAKIREKQNVFMDK